MLKIRKLTGHIAAAFGLALAVAGAAQAAGGNDFASFPENFTVPIDVSLQKPVIGFGGTGKVRRTPVILLHGNDGTPYPTGYGRFSMDVQGLAKYLNANGYSTSELWALGYQGDQSDQIVGFNSWAKSASQSHTISDNVPDLRAFVKEVLRVTRASQVDIVAHGTAVVLVREWVRQDSARRLVRRFVAIEGPNQGTLMCSSDPANPWAGGFAGGFTPASPVCDELGSPNTPFLQTLNAAKDGGRVQPSDTQVIRNADQSFMFIPGSDGLVGTSPSATDMWGNPVDFSSSAAIRGATPDIVLTGQGAYDVLPNGSPGVGSAHVGIANSPITWQATLTYLTKK